MSNVCCSAGRAGEGNRFSPAASRQTTAWAERYEIGGKDWETPSRLRLRLLLPLLLLVLFNECSVMSPGRANNVSALLDAGIRQTARGRQQKVLVRPGLGGVQCLVCLYHQVTGCGRLGRRGGLSFAVAKGSSVLPQARGEAWQWRCDLVMAGRRASDGARQIWLPPMAVPAEGASKRGCACALARLLLAVLGAGWIFSSQGVACPSRACRLRRTCLKVTTHLPQEVGCQIYPVVESAIQPSGGQDGKITQMAEPSLRCLRLRASTLATLLHSPH